MGLAAKQSGLTHKIESTPLLNLRNTLIKNVFQERLNFQFFLDIILLIGNLRYFYFHFCATHAIFRTRFCVQWSPPLFWTPSEQSKASGLEGVSSFQGFFGTLQSVLNAEVSSIQGFSR